MEYNLLLDELLEKAEHSKSKFQKMLILYQLSPIKKKIYIYIAYMEKKLVPQ